LLLHALPTLTCSCRPPALAGRRDRSKTSACRKPGRRYVCQHKAFRRHPGFDAPLRGIAIGPGRPKQWVPAWRSRPCAVPPTLTHESVGTAAQNRRLARNHLRGNNNSHLHGRNIRAAGSAESRLCNGTKVALRVRFDPCERKRGEDSEWAAEAAIAAILAR
jgi:hypothetical protein